MEDKNGTVGGAAVHVRHITANIKYNIRGPVKAADWGSDGVSRPVTSTGSGR